MRTRLLSILTMLSLPLFLLFLGAVPVQAARLNPATTPKSGGIMLVGFDSLQFHSKQYAYIDDLGDIEELSFAAGGSWQVANLTALAGGLPASSLRAANGPTLVGFDSPQFHAKQYAYVDDLGDIEELSFAAGGSWQLNDLTALAHAPKAEEAVLTGFDSPQFHSKQYTYVTTQGHVEELSFAAGSSWQAADLTNLAGGAPAASVGFPEPFMSGLAGFDSPQFHSKQYTYVTTQGHVEELWFVAGGSWQAADLTNLAGGAPNVASGFGLTLVGFDSHQFHAKQYAYVNAQGNLEELSFVAGGSWQSTADLAGGPGVGFAPNVASPTIAGFDSPQFHSKQYAYIDTQDHIEEVWLAAGSSWQAADLTNLTGGTVPDSLAPILTGFDSAQFHSKQYAYITAQGDVEELWFDAGGSWQAADLSLLAQ